MTYTHVVDYSASTSTVQFSTNSYTNCDTVKFNQPVRLYGMAYKPYTSSSTWGAKPVIWTTGGSLLVRGNTVTHTNVIGASTGPVYDFMFSGGFIELAANTNYYIGLANQGGQGNAVAVTDISTTGTYNSIPAYTTAELTMPSGHRYSSGDQFPSNAHNYRMTAKLYISPPNDLPIAATNLTTPASAVVNGQPVSLSWTHNDPNGNPQSKYQLRYRIK